MAKERKKLIYVNEAPEGLFYIPEFITVAEEEVILRHVCAQPFEPYDHHGYKANREVVYYGMQGGYNGDGAEEKTEPMPAWLSSLRDRFANLMGLDADELVMALVARYPAGAGIGWHRDRPQFGPTVMGLSLQSDAEMRFRRYLPDSEEMFKIKLERRSVYLISGPSRVIWQHGMIPVKTLRFSITFRTLRDKERDPNDPRHKPIEIARRLDGLQIRYCNAQQANIAADEEPKQLKFAF